MVCMIFFFDKEMEETEGFGSALYQNLQEVLDWAASPENQTNEESLYQFNKICLLYQEAQQPACVLVCPPCLLLFQSECC